MIDAFQDRLVKIGFDILLAENFSLTVGSDHQDPNGRFYFQIRCWREDVITGEMGYGYGGKAYLSPHMTDSELVQIAFGLYKGYYEHEARETFRYKARRVFGPHISVEALWEVARRVDVRSAAHVEDTPSARYARDVEAWVAAGSPPDSVPALEGADSLDFSGYRADPHYDLGGSPA